MHKYTALRTLAAIQRLVAVLIAGFGAIGLILAVANYGPRLVAGGMIWMIVALVAAFPLWCYADLLYVFMDIEENTRHFSDEIRAALRHEPSTTSIQGSDDLSRNPMSVEIYPHSNTTSTVPTEATRLTVTSEPQGAAVYIDGHWKEGTPATLNVEQGEHLVEIKVIGHKPYAQKVNCEGIPIKIHAKLESASSVTIA